MQGPRYFYWVKIYNANLIFLQRYSIYIISSKLPVTP